MVNAVKKHKRVIVQFNMNHGHYQAGEMAVFDDPVARWMSENPAGSSQRIASIIGDCDKNDSGLEQLVAGGAVAPGSAAVVGDAVKAAITARSK